MRNSVIALVVIWLLSALTPSSARAQARCGDPDPEVSISVCSAIIQAGRARGRDLAVAHTERGVAYVALLDYDRALHDFGEAIRIDATFAKAFANRGAVHGAKQDFDKAIDDFTRALKLEPRSSHAFADRAGMHRLNGQHDEAIRDYTEAIRMNPAFAEAILNRAITLAGTSRCADAIADFTRAIELFESEPGTRTGTGTRNAGTAIALVDRGVCYEKSGRDDLAVEGLLRAPRARAALAVWPRASWRAVLPCAAIRPRARRLRAGARREPELADGALRARVGETEDRRRARRRRRRRDGQGHA